MMKFGTTELEVSRVGLGCMRMSEPGADDRESIATVQMAIDSGVNLLDTSASYGSGHNQNLIAKALRGRRERVIVHSKSGSPRTQDGAGTRGGGSPEYLTRVCNESLARLGTDRLDVYCLSRVDPHVPIEESVGAIARLVEEGKVRYIALSEAGPDSIRRANAVYPIASLQMEYSLWSRDVENGNLQACREAGMALMPYSVLGRGFLAGAYRSLADLPPQDSRRQTPRFQPGNFERNLGLLEEVEALAREKSVTLAQIAIAWVAAQGRYIFPIPGAKTRAHLAENLKAASIVMSPEDLARLDAILPPGAAAGERLPREQLARVNL